MDYRQIIAIENEYKRQLKDYFPNEDLLDKSGIYVFIREDESGLRFAYVGQAKKVLTRLAQHLMGYKAHNPSHIDLSLKKRGFYSKEDRPYGWEVFAFYCDENDLDNKEREKILHFGRHYGYQLYNKTSGGQDGGKVGIAPNAPARGYRDGLKQGYENARRDVAKLFENNLRAEINGNPNKLKERAMAKFEEFIKNCKKI